MKELGWIPNHVKKKTKKELLEYINDLLSFLAAERGFLISLKLDLEDTTQFIWAEGKDNFCGVFDKTELEALVQKIIDEGNKIFDDPK